MAAGVPARLSARAGRKFGLTVGIAFLVLAGLVYFWRHRVVTAEVFAAIGTALMLAGLVIPTALGPVERAWMAFAHALSKVTTPIFMGVVYFVVVTPIGLVMRLFGRQPLAHVERDGGFWIEPPSGGRSDMGHQF